MIRIKEKFPVTLERWKASFKRLNFQWSFSNYTQLYFFFSHLSLLMKQKKNLAETAVSPGRLALFPHNKTLLIFILIFAVLSLLQGEINGPVLIVLAALYLLYKVLDSFHYRFNTLRANLYRGMSLSESIKNAGSTLFPPFIVALISWGEETQQLPLAVKNAQRYLKGKIDQFNKRETIYLNYLVYLTISVTFIASYVYHNVFKHHYRDMLDQLTLDGKPIPAFINIPFLGEIAAEKILAQQGVFFEYLLVFLIFALVLFIVQKAVRSYIHYRLTRNKAPISFFLLILFSGSAGGFIITMIREYHQIYQAAQVTIISGIAFAAVIPLCYFVLKRLVCLIVRVPRLAVIVPLSWKRDLSKRMILLLEAFQGSEYSLSEIFYITGKYSGSMILLESCRKWSAMAEKGIPIAEILQEPLWYVPYRNVLWQMFQKEKLPEVEFPEEVSRVMPSYYLYVLHGFNILCLLQLAVPLFALHSLFVQIHLFTG